MKSRNPCPAARSTARYMEYDWKLVKGPGVSFAR
jgi:hypothetical protein